MRLAFPLDYADFNFADSSCIGTGKTVTGAHLAYVLARKLQRERLMPTSANSSSSPDDLKPCVMYCAPSNQAVNVVLG